VEMAANSRTKRKVKIYVNFENWKGNGTYVSKDSAEIAEKTKIVGYCDNCHELLGG